MLTMYRAFLVIMAVIAGLMMPEALALPKDAQYTIGPGFLPSIMLGATIVACLILLALAIRSKTDAKIEGNAVPRLVLYVISTALLIFAMEHVGIILSVIVYIFCVIFFIEKNSALSAAKVALVTGTGIYLIFHTGLQVPMSICNFF